MSCALMGLWALWDNTITVAIVTLLKEAFNFLHVALWKQCTETKDCSVIHRLLCTCASIHRSKRDCLRVKASRFL
jgi:hypothetical protein